MCVASREMLFAARVEHGCPPEVEFNAPPLFKPTRRTSLMFQLAVVAAAARQRDRRKKKTLEMNVCLWEAGMMH